MLMMMTPSSRLSMPSKSTERSTQKCKLGVGNSGILGEFSGCDLDFSILGSNTRS